LLGYFLFFFTPYKVIVGDHAKPRRALGFWFLSPVGLFVLVFSGNFLAMHMTDLFYIRAMLFLNVLLMGVAFLFTGIVYVIFMYRAFFL